MATKRQKRQIITGVSRSAAEDAFAAYVKARAELAKLTADMELACTRIREKYQERLAALSTEMDEKFETLLAYAGENREQLFAKKKSHDMAHGTIGYRIGMPKLKTIKGFTWASALQLAKEFLPEYVRTTEEVAKDKLLADRNGVLIPAGAGEDAEGTPIAELMARCGIMVTQDESFFVEPKQEGGDL